jgi:hypothetical protein
MRRYVLLYNQQLPQSVLKEKNAIAGHERLAQTQTKAV